MSDSTRILSHQGRDLRLSLPLNDYRQDHGAEIKTKEEVLALEIEPLVFVQTVDIFPDLCDDANMRVVCSISNRIKWDQRVLQVREKKLQELGVGVVQNRPQVVLTHKPDAISAIEDRTPNWTGLHTPAVSTGSSITSTNALPGHALPTLVGDADSLTAQVEALRERHHQLSRSVSDLTSTVPISRRELVHHRLNSIPPVIMRHGSRVVSGIGSIKEMPEEDLVDDVGRGRDTSDNKDGGRACVEPMIATNTAAFHQHLASHDMSELIKPQLAPRQNLQGDLYLPDFGHQYESFNWADESMDSDTPIFTKHNPAPFDHQQLTTFDFEPVACVQAPLDLQPHSQHLGNASYFYPASLGAYVNPVLYTDANDQSSFQQYHTAQKSSLNFRAEAFVPFAQAVVKPSTESHAIPIVRPCEAVIGSEADLWRAEDTVVEGQSQHACSSQVPFEAPYDAYDGFDSGSEDGSEGEEQDISDNETASLSGDHDLGQDSNEERVKSFKFPSPCKSGVVTPARSRTAMFDSASPEGISGRLSTTLPPPKMSSTPRKSPKIFQKSVELEDTELDSIIMDLSIRKPIARQATEQSDSDDSTDEVLLNSEPEDYTSSARPRLRKVPSTRLLLSHEDTDVGLLLDAMLSAKFAHISDALNGVQGTVQSLGTQVTEVSTTLARSQIQAPAWHIDPTSLAEKDIEIAELRSRIKHCEHTLAIARDEAAERAGDAERLRQELWNALAEVNERKAEDICNDSKLNPTDHRSEHSGGQTMQSTSEDLATKLGRLEGQLLESTAFCGALQTQYTASELSLTKLRKELSDVQVSRDQAIARVDDIGHSYELLQQHLHETAAQVADDQSRWTQIASQKDAEIEELMRRLNQEQGILQRIEPHNRRASSVSTDFTSMDSQFSQFLMDRVKALEYSNSHLQSAHKQELERRDERMELLYEDWKQMTKAVAAAECTEDGLRAEIVMNAEIEDHLTQDLNRAHNLIDALTIQLGKAGPIGILKRSKSASEIRKDSLTDQAIIRLTHDIQQRDAKIAELEALLSRPQDSTERQILSAISENIRPSTDCAQDSNLDLDADHAQKVQAARVAELKRMRMSWESKHAPNAASVEALTVSGMVRGTRVDM